MWNFKHINTLLSSPQYSAFNLDYTFILSILFFLKKKYPIQPLLILQPNTGPCDLRTGVLSPLLYHFLISSLLTSSPSWLVILEQRSSQGFPKLFVCYQKHTNKRLFSPTSPLQCTNMPSRYPAEFDEPVNGKGLPGPHRKEAPVWTTSRMVGPLPLPQFDGLS